MKKVGLVSVVISLILFQVALSYAEIPKLINYQGHLTDKGGNPLTGTVSITFTIYDTPAGMNALWSETQGIVAVNNGIFNILLGTATVGGVATTVFDGSDRWLGIAVQGDSEMNPRQQLVSVPYAYNANNLNGQDASYYTNSDNFTGNEWTELTGGGSTTLHTHPGGGVGASYDSGWFYVSQYGFYTLSHNLNTKKVIAQIWFSDSSDGSTNVFQAYQFDHRPLGMILRDLTNTQISLYFNEFVRRLNPNGTWVDYTFGYARIIAIGFE